MSAAPVLAHNVGELELPVTKALRRLGHAAPSLLAARSLQQRVDSKYVLPVSAVPTLLQGIEGSHQVVMTGALAAPLYETLYWDTGDLEMFHAHRRGRRPRYKVRVRHHTDRGRTFLEIKKKGGNNRTVKQRDEREFGDSSLSLGNVFVRRHGPALASELRPVLWTNFRRITLVGVNTEERLTIDLSLVFDSGDAQRQLGPVAICEVKQLRHSWGSPSIQNLRRLGVRPSSMSKYCTGICLLFPAVRRGVFKPQLRALRTLVSTGGSTHV